MKILSKQIKIGNIGKYIQKNDLKWLLFLLVPLVIGLIVHFAIPVTFVLNGNPAAQQTYNNQKISLEQKTVRSASLLNSQIIRKKLQRFENIRNFLIRIFGEINPYQKIVPSQIILNNAHQIANAVNNGGNISSIASRSMWYAKGKSTFQQLDPVQQYVYGQYLSVEPYIRAELLNINNSPQQSVLKGISLSSNYLGQPLYFEYPSKFKSDFLSLETSSFDKYYNMTMYNYLNSNASFEYMIFSQQIDGQNQLVICSIIFQRDTPVGVATFYVTLSEIAQQLTQNLGIPNITYSTTSYYLLTPIYPSFSLEGKPNLPQIIFNFTDKHSQNINYPVNDFFQLPSNLNPSLYKPQPKSTFLNYSFFVTFQTDKLIYIQVPINVYSYLQKKQTILFLLVQYNFQGSVFNSIAKYSQIFRDLSIPSLIVIVVSTILSLIILKCLLNSLDQQLHKINAKCEFLLHGDLDLSIPEYENTEELKEVYKNLKIVNYLHKFSTPQFFKQKDEKKIVKLFKVWEVFQQLNYSTDVVLQNIGDCYLTLGEIFKAIQFLIKSYDLLVKEVQAIFEQPFQKILILKHQQQKKLSKKYRRYELKLIGRLFKIILAHNMVLSPPPQISFQRQRLDRNYQKSRISDMVLKKCQNSFRKYLSVFKKLAYPNFITSESMLAYLIEASFQLNKKNIKAAKLILKRFKRIMSEYGNQFQNAETLSKGNTSPIKTYQQMKQNLSSYCKVTPAMMWSVFYYVQGLILSENIDNDKDLAQMVNCYKKATDGNHFSEDIHIRVCFQMVRISYAYGFTTQTTESIISQFSYFKQMFPLYHLRSGQKSENLSILSQIKSGVEKQILFMFDCSNKWISTLEQFRKWQKQTRQMSLAIFNLLSPQDRVSIMKVNSTVYIETCCNLTQKGYNQSLIANQLSNAIKLKFMSGRCKIIKALPIVFNRIKMLEQEKFIIVFLKQQKLDMEVVKEKTREQKLKKISSSSNQFFKHITTHNFNSNTKLRKNTEISPTHKPSIHSKADSGLNSFEEDQQQRGSIDFSQYYKALKDQIIVLLLMPQISNLNLVLITDNSQSFKKRFSLGTINETIDAQYVKRDRYNNNKFFVLDFQSQDQIERIFEKKSIKTTQQNFLNMF